MTSVPDKDADDVRATGASSSCRQKVRAPPADNSTAAPPSDGRAGETRGGHGGQDQHGNAGVPQCVLGRWGFI